MSVNEKQVGYVLEKLADMYNKPAEFVTAGKVESWMFQLHDLNRDMLRVGLHTKFGKFMPTAIEFREACIGLASIDFERDYARAINFYTQREGGLDVTFDSPLQFWAIAKSDPHNLKQKKAADAVAIYKKTYARLMMDGCEPIPPNSLRIADTSCASPEVAKKALSEIKNLIKTKGTVAQNCGSLKSFGSIIGK
jgi:hypothetical protein